jgi:hypothetical protein
MRILFRPFIPSFFFLFICVHPLSSQTSNHFAYQFLYTGDLLYNALGGIKSGVNYLGIANINIAFDTQKAKMWQGGTFFVNLANMHGSEPSKNLPILKQAIILCCMSFGIIKKSQLILLL